MGIQQQVYAAVSGDYSGGPNAHDRGDTAGVTRGAIDYFWGLKPSGANTAVIALGDLVGADSNSASYLRMYDVWGGGDENPGTETYTCQGQAPAISVHGALGRCYDHTGTGPHTGYMNAAIRNVTLPIPGNHDRDSGDNPGPYDGYWSFWREKNGELPNQLRPTALGFPGSTAGTAYETGPFRYTADLPAQDGKSYWRVGLIDVDPWLVNGPSSQKAGIISWLQGELAAAAAASPPRHMIWGWHEPTWQIGGSDYGTNAYAADIVDLLQSYSAGFMVILGGHIHGYARWNPVTYNGQSIDTSATHGQTAISQAAYEAGGAGVIHIQSGLGGQNPMWVPLPGSHTTYWQNVGVQQPPICRPNAGANDGQNRATVSWFQGASAQEQPRTNSGGDPAAQAELDRTGQPGFPYGITGMVLDSDRFSFKFYGNRAPYTGYPSTQNILVYDSSPTYIWGGATVTPPTTTAAWRSGELYGGGGCQSINFAPGGTKVITGGDNNGPKTSFDSGATWVTGYGGFDDNSMGELLQTVAVLLSRDPATPNRAWNGNKHAFMVSNNNGLDWVPVPTWTGNFTHDGPNNDRPRVDGHCIDDDGIGHLFMVDSDAKVFRYNIAGTNGDTGNFVQVANLTDVGTSCYLDPIDKTVLYVTTRNQGLYQLHGILGGAGTATVRSFTGTGSPAHTEEVVPVNEGGTTVLYVASVGNRSSTGAFTSNGTVKKVNRGSGSSGSITNAFTDISPSAPGSPQWAGIDALRSGGATIVAVGNSNPGPASTGMTNVYSSANGGTSWTLQSGDDTDNDFVNAMGGPGGKKWWGYGMRAGSKATEKSANRWIEQQSAGRGGVESIAIDPAAPNRIIGAGQNGCWLFDTTAKKAYPAQVGVHSAVECFMTIDPSDDNVILLSNSDHLFHMTRTGGSGGDWWKNESGATSGTTSFFQTSITATGVYATFGHRFDNTMGDLYFNANPQAGTDWVSLGLPSGMSGAKPVGINVRRISGNDVVLIGVLRKTVNGVVVGGGIYKKTFAPGNPPTGVGGWTRVEPNFAAAPNAKTQRAYPIRWASNTLAFALDPGGGLWRTTDAGDNWTKIFTFDVGADERGAFFDLDLDNPGDVYVSLSASAGAALRGAYHLVGANIGVVANVPDANPSGTNIQVIEMTKPGGVFSDPGVVASTTLGRVGVVEWGTGNFDPKAYYSTNYGSTFTDVTDAYFRHSVRKTFSSAMTTTGRWFITMNGPGVAVYDTTGTVVDPPASGIARAVVMANGGWAITDPSLATYTSDTVTPVAGKAGILVIDIANSDSAAALVPTSVTFAGKAATKKEDQNLISTDLTQREISTWTVVLDGTEAAGPVTVTYAAAQNGIAVEATEYTNVDFGAGGGLPLTVGVTKRVVLADTAQNNSGPYTTTSWTPTAGNVIMAVVNGVSTTGVSPGQPTITDSGSRSWTPGPSNLQVSTDGYRTQVFWALAGGSPTSTTVTANWPATVHGCIIEVLEFSNADTTSPIVQSATSAPAASTSPTISLTSPPAATSMVLVMNNGRRNPPAWTDEAGWVLQGDSDTTTGSPPNGLHVATRNGDQTWVATGINGTSWGLILEVAGAIGGSTDPIVQSLSTDWGSTASRPTISLTNPLAKPGQNAVHTASVTTRTPAAWDPETGWDELWDSGYSNPTTGINVDSILLSQDNSFAAAGGTNGRWAATILEIAAGAISGTTGTELSYDADYIAGNLHELSHDADYLALSYSLNLLTSGASDVDAGNVTTASITPTSGRTVYTAIENARSDSITANIPTLSGAGLTWTRIASLPFSENVATPQRRRISIFQGTGTPSAGALTIDFGGGAAPAGTYEAAVILAATGYAGNAISFTNPVTNWATLGVDVAASSLFSSAVTNSFTVDGWVTQTSTGGNRRVFQMGAGGSPTEAALYYSAGSLTGVIKIATALQSVSWADSGLLATGAHHVAIRYVDATDELSVWVDGIKRNQATFSGTLNITGTVPLRIGNVPSSATSNDAWDGTIDEFAWYTTALSDAQLAAHAAALPDNYVGVVTADSPVAYYRFEEVSGTVAANTVSPANQTHIDWIALESNGNAVLQTLSGTALNVVTTLTMSTVNSTGFGTALAFTGKRGAAPLFADAEGEEIIQVANVLPSGAFQAQVVALDVSPKTIDASSSETQDMGMIALELAPLNTSALLSHTADYIALGTVTPSVGKKRPRRHRLSQVFASVGGREIPFQDDFEFSETAMGGYDKATLAVPLQHVRAIPTALEQDAPVFIWNAQGEELWFGTVDKPPEQRDGVANIEASGPQYRARQANDRLFYQAVGTELWSGMDADPYNFPASERLSADVGAGRMMLTTQKGESIDSGKQAGFVCWIPGSDLRRLQFKLRRSEGTGLNNFMVRVAVQKGPSTNPLNVVASYQADLQDGSVRTTDLTGNFDLVALFIECTTNNTNLNNTQKVWFSDISVNGIAKSIDYMSTASITKDIGKRLGYYVGDALESSDINGLPLDINDQDWGEALDYLSVLDDMPWQAYGDYGDGPVMRKADWRTNSFRIRHEHGATFDLTPEPIYEQVRVVFTRENGTLDEVTRQSGNGRELPPYRLSDPQPDNSLAKALADRLLAENSADRWTGTINLAYGDRLVRSGRVATVEDWAPEDQLTHQIQDVSQTAEGIRLGIRSPQIVSRFLARSQKRADRRAR